MAWGNENWGDSNWGGGLDTDETFLAASNFKPGSYRRIVGEGLIPAVLDAPEAASSEAFFDWIGAGRSFSHD